MVFLGDQDKEGVFGMFPVPLCVNRIEDKALGHPDSQQEEYKLPPCSGVACSPSQGMPWNMQAIYRRQAETKMCTLTGYSDISIASSAREVLTRKGKQYQHELYRVQSRHIQRQRCPSTATKPPQYIDSHHGNFRVHWSGWWVSKC